MGSPPAPTNTESRINPFVSGAEKHPAAVSFSLLLLAFAVYAYTNDYVWLIHDASGYWSVTVEYFQTGAFEFLSYSNHLRGYLFPLLLAPLAYAASLWPVLPIDLTRAMGVLMGAALFGIVIPQAWQAVLGPNRAQVSWGRRVLLGALGLIFWRGHFNFPLTDFPAFLALVACIWALVGGRSVLSGLAAGICVAAALNFRPIYIASLPPILILALLPQSVGDGEPLHKGRQWLRRVALVLGMLLVLWPQMLINQQYYGVDSPLVLTAKPDEPSLFLSQLRWGLHYQKYETGMANDYPSPRISFPDPAAQELFITTGLADFTSFDQYWDLIISQPIGMTGVYLRHLFNGLDIQYPDPFLRQVYVSSWPLALLNYSVLFGGVVLLLSKWRLKRTTLRVALAAAAVLAPCLAILPGVMECRFLMPLHLLLCTIFAFEAQPWRAWQVTSLGRRLGFAAVYAAVLVGCFAISTSTQTKLEHAPRYPFEWQRPTGQPW